MSTDKSNLSERDICTKFILPALERAGWDRQSQLFEEYPLRVGRVVVRGNKGKRDMGSARRADYALFHKPGIPLAVIEAKDNHHSVRDGIQQALAYAEMLDVPFAFSSNGDGFLFHDRTGADGVIERELTLDEFPSPAELWSRYTTWKGLPADTAPLLAQDYHPGKRPRYYQIKAINRVVEAVACHQRRLLLVMATGTGKTLTAFQIIWRLWKSGAVKRTLFLADRNILIDQTKVNDFQPFGGAMTKIENRNVDPAYEIYLSLYQAVTGNEEDKNIYKQFSPDFFDLIVVDECHRGSAAEDSAWREVLDYFSCATHLGLTATPKETAEVSNISYFGEPVYTYSLRQGIEDGYLAPYKVVRIDLDKDLGWRPPMGKTDKHGLEIEDRIYNRSDINRTLVLEQRDVLVAERITQLLKATDRYGKTIVFCDDIDHAARMRQALLNANADLAAKNPKYVVQITGDNEEGKRELDNFIDPEKLHPVIATTSRLMNTGVDAQTCKLIVLDRTINSMTEFKQIIGRGTRINEDYDKLWFTILDFKRATEHFADPAFDGEPVVIYEPGPDEPIAPPDDPAIPEDHPIDLVPEQDEAGHPRIKYVIGDVPVYVAREQVQYYGPDGRLVTESLRDYTRIVISRRFTSLDDFLQTWSAAEKKQAVIGDLEAQGVFFDELAQEVGKELDPFDLVLHIAFGQKPLTRRERALNVKKRNVFGKYGATARQVLEALLDKYADEGIANIEQSEVLRLAPLNTLGSPVELIQSFGGRPQYLQALAELERSLYQ